jgi:hypothetical protein
MTAAARLARTFALSQLGPAPMSLDALLAAAAKQVRKVRR